MLKPIYLDYAAATPLDKQVAKAMQPFFAEQFFNPSSTYQAAKVVKNAVADARARVAHWLGAKSAEIIFTAGATESINLAIHGVMRRYPTSNIIVSPIEHDAVLEAAGQYSHKKIKVGTDGTINLDSLKQTIDEKTVLVSIGYANNEIGTIQQLSEISNILKQVRKLRQLKNNDLPLYFHTDASQAGCYLDLHSNRLGADLVTINGGKMHGPKQTGALYVKAGTELKPLVSGGGQEMGLRAGTENVPGIIGLATALDIAQQQRKAAVIKAKTLRDKLQQELVLSLPDVKINGNLKKRMPNILNLSLAKIDGERLVMQLDELGVMVSTGSACAANKQTASHVLKAVGLSDELVQGSLRISLGRLTTEAEVKKAAKLIVRAVKEQL